MGWVTEDGLHEGYAVAVLADGRDATAADNPVSGNTAWWCFDGQDGRPLAVGVRAGCDCYAAASSRVARTWRGDTVHPVVFGDDEATEGFTGPSGPYAEWENTHIAPADSATVPGDVTALLAEMRERLTALAEERPLAALTAVAQLEATAAAGGIRAAATAQQRGSSWTDIGKAVGTSKQAAHQRFARHLKPRPAILDEGADPAGESAPQTEEDLCQQQRTPGAETR
ncbi:hypothetical protein [Streptomyces poriferorum]|uniref:DNA-binding protein n=1 Tax=Streptomyces poriferorum TaxID=2798799 RepID=A0ABY9J2C9_9ACTN|nr:MULTISPECIES: hypothetical protein [unclassified Streptomyces]MDP5317409.1 hypothetical protein [Streptomyces sp. Alt4]WLQ62015.1 hypothetical protein P8A19_41820 [Streptomyces sp. Alt2]